MRPLPRFAGTGGDGGRRADPDLVAFVLAEYAAGRSLREIAELNDRSHGAIRYLLQRRGVLRRGRGAPSTALVSSRDENTARLTQWLGRDHAAPTNTGSTTLAKAVIYLPVEFRPGRGTFDVYSAQSTLEEAVGWYAKQKGYSSRPADLEEHQGPEGTTWRLDVDSDGGFAVINRYAVPIVETED